MKKSIKYGLIGLIIGILISLIELSLFFERGISTFFDLISGNLPAEFPAYVLALPIGTLIIFCIIGIVVGSMKDKK